MQTVPQLLSQISRLKLERDKLLRRRERLQKVVRSAQNIKNIQISAARSLARAMVNSANNIDANFNQFGISTKSRNAAAEQNIRNLLQSFKRGIDDVAKINNSLNVLITSQR